MADPPEFVQDGRVDAVREFKTFLNAERDAAAHVLAELTAMQSGSFSSAVPASDQNTNARDLYCRVCAGWCVFYALETPTLPTRVTILYVDEILKGFDLLEAEALRRMR